jgi:hypothetical protein
VSVSATPRARPRVDERWVVSGCMRELSYGRT